MIKHSLRKEWLLFSVVWYDFMSKQTFPFFLTMANHSLSHSMRKVRKVGNISWGILEYAPALAQTCAIE